MPCFARVLLGAFVCIFKYTWFHIWKKWSKKHHTPGIEVGELWVSPLASGEINFTVLDQPSQRLCILYRQALSLLQDSLKC